MANQKIDIGIEGNDGTGDSIRESFRKVNENFQELYAVFGIGGQISIIDLSDTPDTYEGNENKVLATNSVGTNTNFLELASDGTIGFDFSVEGKLIIRQLVSKLANDPEPVLTGPLNAGTQPIANVSIDQAAVDTYNTVHSTNPITIDDLVITKGYADASYQAKVVAGGGLRLPYEPSNTDAYVKITSDLSGGYFNLEHGFTSEYNGAAFVFNSAGDDPFGVISGNTYYINVVDDTKLSLHSTAPDAINGSNRILISGGDAPFTISDEAYDSTLEGNWLANNALPRTSIVRREGDTMTGALNLFDHPGDLAGIGTPNGDDDLQAVTKLYVDNATTYSQVNLYVSTTGDDLHTSTPPGKEGRSPAYAYQTINAAAQKAEELMIAAPYEPGPYMQTMTYNAGASNGVVSGAGADAPPAGRTNARAMVVENKEFIQKEVIAYINDSYPDFLYDTETYERDIDYILESITLDSLMGDNANYLSRQAGIRYYSNPSSTRAITTQRTETLAAINYVKSILPLIISSTDLPVLYQDAVLQYKNLSLDPDANAESVLTAKLNIVIDIINVGVFLSPPVADGPRNYRVNVDNGGTGFIDQATPISSDIIPGKVIRGKTSGAIGRIIEYLAEDGGTPVTLPGTDEIEVQLLEPIEFLDGEALEYGNLVKNKQISILVESGIYQEHLPIKISENVSVVGDEFRRCIIRPKAGVSESRYSQSFFYRDAVFDGLTIASDGVAFTNPLTETVDGYFGYHYLTDPTDPDSTPKSNADMDVFLMNDATIIRNLTVQGHGGFMCVLDPDGQILTKSPYIQTGSSFSKSLNRQAFRGGLYIDAFTGNSAVQVIERVDGNPFRLSVTSLPNQGLFLRKPQTPSPFYIDGRRFQIDVISAYDPELGTAELILSSNSNGGTGFTGVTSSLSTGVDLDDFTSPIDITIQTAGNRSMLANDFTQINDLGYGLVCNNGALSENVSMFTYYCWTSYYALNGSQIRSLTGSSCYGEYGLIAEGADPNEVPDAVVLGQDMVMSARTVSSDSVLYLAGPVVVDADDVLVQQTSGATGTVSVSTGANGSSVVYLINTTGIFNTSDEIEVLSVSLGANSVPYDVDNTGYDNAVESLYIHAYDMIDPPSNRSEIDVWHPSRPSFARYEIASVSVSGIHIGRFQSINDVIPATTVSTAGAGAVFSIYKTIADGYTVNIESGGTDYAVNDTITVDGSLLSGVTLTNDAVITVTEVTAGVITGASVAGTIAVDPSTPKYSGIVYKLNFTTTDAQFSINGLLATVPWGEIINYRRNQTHIISDIAEINSLTIRPSTAVVFAESPDTVYRSISFLSSDSIGNDLAADALQVGLDSSYDYIRLIVDPVRAAETALAGAGGTTKGATIGDDVIAVIASADFNEIYRLNNNTRTPEANRPAGWTVDTLTEEAPIFVWGGKKHYVFNYQGVDSDDNIVSIAEDNAYAIVEIAEVGEDINQTSAATGLESPVIRGTETITLRAGLKAGALGDVTKNISTCRATSHDFLEVGTGGFNQSNYPNVIYGAPREADQANEVDERGKGRVFYVSTDQDGVFRVGRFFSVDQGTGTVTFSASLALSDVDGLGFKRGVVISEFSTDSSMGDNATDTIPTESAVRGYVNRRLGFDLNDIPVANKIGSGALSLSGSTPMTGNLNANGNTVSNLAAPVQGSDAATKDYADNIRDTVVTTIESLQDVEINNLENDQLLVSTGKFKIVIQATTIVGGEFNIGDVITGSESSATGTIIDVYTAQDYRGDLVNIIYTATSGAFSAGDDVGAGQDTITTGGGVSGLVIDGPYAEWANGIWDAASDIEVTTDRVITVVAGEVTDRYITLNAGIKANTIVNSDINASAGIVQSKLSMNSAAADLTSASGITQNDLGLAAFDSVAFESTNGWVSVKDNGITISKIQQISTGTVLGRSAAGTGSVSEISFSTIADAGGAIMHTDIPGTTLGIISRTGTDTYSIEQTTIIGGNSKIVKTRSNGSIQANSLILGSDSTYEILSLSGTQLIMKTPAQGVVLTATGGTNPTVNIPGSLSIDGSSVTQTTFQSNSPLANNSRIGVSWIKTAFIEAYGEGDVSSTGIALGANNGFTIADQIGLVVGGSMPFKVTETAILPDVPDVYNIGSDTLKYDKIYANEFVGAIGGSATQVETVSTSINSNHYITFVDSNNTSSTAELLYTDSGLYYNPSTDSLTVTGDLAVNGAAQFGGNTTFGNATTDTISFSGRVNTNIVPSSSNVRNLGSNSLVWNTVYATLFSGTATQAYYADLAENYLGDADYEPGTVLVFGGEFEVTQTARKNDHRAAGIVTTNPAHLMNSALTGDHVIGVALQGRVPCKVVGKVEKGDILVTSAIPGFACVNNAPTAGTVIGKSLENKTDTERGIIEVVVGKH